MYEGKRPSHCIFLIYLVNFECYASGLVFWSLLVGFEIIFMVS